MPSIIYYVKEARKRPLSFLIRKVLDVGRGKVKHFSDGAVFKPYRIPDSFAIVENDAFKFFFERKTLLGDENLLKGITDLPEYTAFLQRCDELVVGRFNILGLPEMKITSPVDWNKDYSTGYKWERKYFKNYSYDELTCLDEDADVKVAWELARLQFLPQLAIAYLSSKDKKYLEATLLYLEDWMESNPVGWGLGWRSTMESALRAISLIWVNRLLDEELTERGLRTKLIRLLYQHGLFVEDNIEYSDINGNHHSSCLLGLYYLGWVFSEDDSRARCWRSSGAKGLEREILQETYEDGLLFEGSLPYHRLVSEFFLHAAILGKKNKTLFSKRFNERLRLMLDAPLAYSKPNGLVPVWGDTDNGQVLKIGGCNINDHLYLAEAASFLFDEEPRVFKSTGGYFHLDTFWLFPSEVVASDETRKLIETDGIASHAFKESGLYVMRRKNNYVFTDCGDTGLLGRGSHGHNDLLSTVISLVGLEVIIERGNGAYTRSRTNRLADISMTTHNAPCVNGEEYAAIRTAGFIVAKNPEHFTVKAFDPVKNVFTGAFRYEGASGTVETQRTVKLSDDAALVTITDRVQVTDKVAHQQVQWMWTMAELWDYGGGEELTFTHRKTGDKLLLKTTSNVTSVTMRRVPFYPSYGKEQETWGVICLAEQTASSAEYVIEFSLLQKGAEV